VSYDVHIHRAKDSFEASENPIPREEWEAWVANAPDFHFDEANFVIFRYDDDERKEYLAAWTAHPQGKEFALYYYDGSVVTTGNPDEYLLRRMAKIAHDLGARLQGDDGEFYGPDGEPLPED
jgi:hypothetical protein